MIKLDFENIYKYRYNKNIVKLVLKHVKQFYDLGSMCFEFFLNLMSYKFIFASQNHDSSCYYCNAHFS